MKREGKGEGTYFPVTCVTNANVRGKLDLDTALALNIEATSVTYDGFPTQRRYYDFNVLLRSLC